MSVVKSREFCVDVRKYNYYCDCCCFFWGIIWVIVCVIFAIKELINDKIMDKRRYKLEAEKPSANKSKAKLILEME